MTITPPTPEVVVVSLFDYISEHFCRRIDLYKLFACEVGDEEARWLAKCLIESEYAYSHSFQNDYEHVPANSYPSGI